VCDSVVGHVEFTSNRGGLLSVLEHALSVFVHTLNTKSVIVLADSLFGAGRTPCGELFPAFEPWAVASDSDRVIGTVLVPMSSPKAKLTRPDADSCVPFPAFNPWTIALNAVDFISTEFPGMSTTKSHPSMTTIENCELLPRFDPWAVTDHPVDFISTPSAASASSKCQSAAMFQAMASFLAFLALSFSCPSSCFCSPSSCFCSPLSGLGSSLFPLVVALPLHGSLPLVRSLPFGRSLPFERALPLHRALAMFVRTLSGTHFVPALF